MADPSSVRKTGNDNDWETMMRRTALRSTACAVTAVAAAGVLALGAGPAAADTVSAAYSCAAGGDTLQTTEKITITAPATAVQGEEIALSVTVEDGTPGTEEVPAGGVRGELDVAVGGTGSGTAVAGGLTNTAAVPAGEAVVLEGGTATVTAPAPGDVTFTPSDLRLNMLGLDVLCTPDETVAPAATTRVTAS
ncbi:MULTISPECIES: hypothetical protein [Streptomyces diastaticus group]|uniref:Uncharacterized protein n=4 Tax=Streptomyces TaxID=1883 RepID=A0A6A0CIW2_9ACTN|nr:hypothetical protein [Streptomyces gougerotii]GFH75930.1 hypothetical protein Sgou_06000 [Streptomyces gougerotii]GFH75937.1 hypothetical protein Sgou_06070 [Streptomyces gougerotii]GFH79671.1 hypothetical protein Sgou_43410 [Streptomyces gougerotii]GGU52011.1 hypothetical protein GCM10010227_00770 [Streptomyces gougerotii]